jgi:hypothetical protein
MDTFEKVTAMLITFISDELIDGIREKKETFEQCKQVFFLNREANLKRFLENTCRKGFCPLK